MASIGGFFKSIMGICETKPLNANLWSVEDGKARVKIDQVPELKQAKGAVYLKGKGLQKPVLILRTEDNRYLAFANVCPHGKRKIDPAPGEPVLRCCSFNHSKFDYDGKRLTGPAKEPLTKYTAEVSGGDLLITLK